jgi:large subunit ribosomal protein L30
MPRRLKIEQVRSTIGRKSNQRRTIRALGIHRLHEPVVHDDTPQVRGMIAKVPHLVKVEEIEHDGQ